MIKHYLKVAFRNMWKYKGQTLISVIGLAVGFACFAMATLWIRYEMSYDSFHKNAGRMYCVNLPNVFTPTGFTRNGPQQLAGYLKSTFPEIAKATTVRPRNNSFYFKLDGVPHKADMLEIDSSFFGMFDVKFIEGSMDFLLPDSKKIAITREKAQQLFGKESPIGKMFIDNGKTICAVVTGLPKRSNYPFDFLEALKVRSQWNYSAGEHTLIELVEGIDVEAYKQKLYEHNIVKDKTTISNLRLTPLTTVRYEDRNIERDVKFEHILIFVLAGSLLILCTLFNYLTLFISRFRLRRRELALRIVYGASVRSLFAMLSVEFVISLIIALLLGLSIINRLIVPFHEISDTRLELSAIYLESTVYIAAIVAVALTAFVLTLAIFRRRTLNATIRGNNRILRKASIIVQLTVSIVFAFCTTVILKQMYYLHNTDLGFSFKNRGSIRLSYEYEQVKSLNDKIRQIPEIEQSISGYTPVLPVYGRMSSNIDLWDDKPKDAENINIENISASAEFAEYYDLELIEGEFLNETGSDNDVVINESAAKTFGWSSPVGKTFDGYKVKGVVKNIYNLSPTVAARPVFFSYPKIYRDRNGYRSSGEMPYILFKFNEGRWKSCVEKIKKIIAAEFPETMYILCNTEEEYDKYLKSENALLAILVIVSLICVTVCVFGFVSMISLTCEERRKEIAIRKINGATIKDILDIFFKEHLTLLVAGALVAFPAGYLIMRRWLENYVVQTEISAWVYVVILLALFMAIVLCVGGRVYKTSRENPVNSIKN
jgi:ABC-type antimicrobial peptide transport system permease subunit